MNIVILTKHDFLFHSISEQLESLIIERHIPNLDLYSFISPSPEDIHAVLVPQTSWLIFLDTSSYLDWKNIISDLIRTAPYLLFCIISEDDRVASELLNLPFSACIAGYINPVSDSIGCCCQTLLSRILTHSVINSGLLVRGRGRENIIAFSDIYYIDTQKGTHLCNIHYTDGVYPIRANIYTLSKQLDWQFRIVRSSTIVNLSHVKHLDMKNNLIYFTPEIYCNFSRTNKKFLRMYFRML